MKQERQTKNRKGFAKKKQYPVTPNGIIGMERVKSYTTATRLEYWRGKKMIQVHQHSQQEQDIDLFPFLSEKDHRNQQRYNQVKKIMNKSLHTNLNVFNLLVDNQNPFLFKALRIANLLQ